MGKSCSCSNCGDLSNKKLVVLGEGIEEARFFPVLVQAKGLSIDEAAIAYCDYGGKTKLKEWLRAFFKSSNFQSIESDQFYLLITRDADNDPDRAKESIVRALDELPPDVSTCHDFGAFPSDQECKVKIAIQLLPDNHRSGYLETLCREAVAHTTLAKCTEEYSQCESANREGSSDFDDKAWVYAYLALASKRRLGELSPEELRSWGWDLDVFERLLSLIREPFH